MIFPYEAPSADKVKFQFLIDWNNDNDFSRYEEDISPWVRDATWSIGMSEPYQLIGDEMRLTLTLNNHDKRFSPENRQSLYYGQMVPRRRIKIISTYANVARVMFLGYVDSIETEGGDGRTTVITGASAKRWMQEQTITLPLLTDIRTDEVLQLILERLQVPAAIGDDNWILGVVGSSELGETTYLGDFAPAVSLDVGDTTFNYVADNWDANFKGNQHVGGDWSDGFRGYDAIEDVIKAERGRFFFGRDGKAHFWNRSRLQVNMSEPILFDNMHQQIVYSYGERIQNDIRVNAYPRKITEDVTLWTLDEEITLKPSKERKIRAKFTEEGSDVKVGGRNVVLDNTDFDSNLSVTLESFGDRAEITITNTSSTADGTVRTLELFGDKLTTFNKQELNAADGLSKLEYGVRETTIDCKLIDSSNYAESIAQYELLRHKDPLGEVSSIMFVNSDAQRIIRSLTTQMGDRIRVIDTQLKHDAEYFVIGERHRWDMHQGSGYQTTFFLEAAGSLRAWVLGEAGYSELGVTTYLGL